MIRHFRREGFCRCVEEKIDGLQTIIDPLFDSECPFINACEIGLVQFIAIEANECRRSSQAHVKRIAPAGSVGDHGSDLALTHFLEKLAQKFRVGEPSFVAQFDMKRKCRVPQVEKVNQIVEPLWGKGWMQLQEYGSQMVAERVHGIAKFR